MEMDRRYFELGLFVSKRKAALQSVTVYICLSAAAGRNCVVLLFINFV